ncbi:helix-turn-helix domain-containing protein [Streptomyces sp. NPDC020875]|uniref:helix-turn-helix domain-containing protein n=1 Tax=Streptomyces sp. NPDC020875 TaxID=3154898 RepID=UPI0033F57C0D
MVEGLERLGRARELAALALAASPSDGLLHGLGDRLSRVFTVARPDLAADVAEQVFGPLRRLERAERAELLTTLAAWLDHGGSTRRAGEALYCHRNTVLNRLRRLERLTGRSPADPRDMVDLALALDAEGVVAPPAPGL